MTGRFTGGCQCGAIRYRVKDEPQQVSICHCRMCQKATGSIVWPFFTVRRDSLVWSRGQPALYRSSAAALRGYCASCGTPLTFEPENEATVDLGIGTLDQPSAMKPNDQYWVDARMPWFGELAGLPEAGLGGKLPADEVARRMPFQHPDHDTDVWTPAGAGR